MDNSAAAVIFDLDGTLVDSEPHYYEAGRRVLADHGVTGFTWQDHTRFIGIGTRQTLETLRAEHGIAAPVEQLLAEKNRIYVRLAAHSTPVFTGMRTLVEQLHGASYPLALASGSSRAAVEAVLEGSGLSALLPVRVSAEEVAHGKPEPDVFLEAARRLGVPPRRCVVLEDAPPGAEAARRAGMRCVAVPYVRETATDPAFASAGLLFAGGQDQFDAARVFDWITGRG
ncbi:HAD family phosphatase [Streptomyces sp. WMMB 322]|uniref:HAD family hydrolase n=1 Tax=Streptomyces sp. WMMB 322 TaxID=1286821 RepID=UPI0006E1D1DD|nr:HAD family phosphatase [Streptomyces sp. WMMB 322]SCK57344.1 haloacid dehalogenase superfamily, subfamily IA, variant 3 with third motif having DD or ED [Streptomyces sp. WMMB 322]